jgi:hypothetical protein
MRALRVLTTAVATFFGWYLASVVIAFVALGVASAEPTDSYSSNAGLIVGPGIVSGVLVAFVATVGIVFGRPADQTAFPMRYLFAGFATGVMCSFLVAVVDRLLARLGIVPVDTWPIYLGALLLLCGAVGAIFGRFLLAGARHPGR